MNLAISPGSPRQRTQPQGTQRLSPPLFNSCSLSILHAEPTFLHCLDGQVPACAVRSNRYAVHCCTMELCVAHPTPAGLQTLDDLSTSEGKLLDTERAVQNVSVQRCTNCDQCCSAAVLQCCRLCMAVLEQKHSRSSMIILDLYLQLET